MRSSVHPALPDELTKLADQSFRMETSIGQLFGAIDALFLDRVSLSEAIEHWQQLPTADAVVGVEYDLRCIDPADGRSTMIVALRGDVLYLLSAGEATRTGREQAARRAVERMIDLTWVHPE